MGVMQFCIIATHSRNEHLLCADTRIAKSAPTRRSPNLRRHADTPTRRSPNLRQYPARIGRPREFIARPSSVSRANSVTSADSVHPRGFGLPRGCGFTRGFGSPARARVQAVR
jgi:hypothetical protein